MAESSSELPSPKLLRESGKDMNASPLMKLSDIIQGFSLPIRLSACNSLYGIGDYFSFFSNDEVDMHFMKETIIANMNMSSGIALKVPLNSDLRASLIHYVSGGVLDQHLTVPELLRTKSLPRIMVVEKGCKGGRKSSAFLEEEMLIPREICNSKEIRCFSLLTEADKRIHKSSKLLLISNPSDCMISFSDIQYLDLPLQVKLHPRAMGLQSIFSAPCIVQSLNAEQSVIATFASHRQSEESIVFEILVDVAMSFQLVKLSEQEKEFLSWKSRSLYDAFTPTCVTKVILNGKDGGGWLQQELYKIPARKGIKERKGIKLFPPTLFTPKNADSLHPSRFSGGVVEYTPLMHPSSVQSVYATLSRKPCMGYNQQYEEIEITNSGSSLRPKSHTFHEGDCGKSEVSIIIIIYYIMYHT